MAISPTNRARAPRSLSSTRVPSSSRSIGQRSLSMTRLGSRAPLPTPRAVSPRPPIPRCSPSPGVTSTASSPSSTLAAGRTRDDLRGSSDDTQRMRKSSLDVMVLQYKIPKGTVFGLYQSPLNSPKQISYTANPTRFDRRISCDSADSPLVKLHRNSKLNGIRQPSPNTTLDHSGPAMTIIGRGLSKEESFRRHSVDDLLSHDAGPQTVGDHHHRGSNHVPARSSSDRIPSYSQTHNIPLVAKTGELPPASRRPVKRSMSVAAPRRQPYNNAQAQAMMITKSCQRIRYKTAENGTEVTVQPLSGHEPISINFESKKTTVTPNDRAQTEPCLLYRQQAVQDNCDVNTSVGRDNGNNTSVTRDIGNKVEDRGANGICNIDDNVDRLSSNTTESDPVIMTRTEPDGGQSDDHVNDHETNHDTGEPDDAVTTDDNEIDNDTTDTDHDSVLPPFCDPPFPEYAKYLTLPRRRSKYQSHLYREKFYSDQSNDSGYSDHILVSSYIFST